MANVEIAHIEQFLNFPQRLKKRQHVKKGLNFSNIFMNGNSDSYMWGEKVVQEVVQKVLLIYCIHV